MIEDLRERVAALSAMEAQLEACLVDVRRAGDRAVAELAAAAKLDMGMRPLGAVPPPNGFILRNIPLEEVRDAVVRLAFFSLAELAAELGCSAAKARVELERVMHLLRPAGHLGQRQLWEYVPPDGPGTAFLVQQRTRVVEPEIEVAKRMAGPQVTQSLLSSISDKEIKRVVRKALDDGWALCNVGGKHPLALVKPGRRDIGISSSPTNSDHAARAIARQVRAAA